MNQLEVELRNIEREKGDLETWRVKVFLKLGYVVLLNCHADEVLKICPAGFYSICILF